MSVLNCPVCQGQMREVNKGGVLIDTCTQCRGVWLDRGELEKLSAMMGDVPPANASFLGTAAPVAPAAQAPYQQHFRRHRDNDDDDDDDRRHYGDRYGKHKKSKVARFLDFFD